MRISSITSIWGIGAAGVILALLLVASNVGCNKNEQARPPACQGEDGCGDDKSPEGDDHRSQEGHDHGSHEGRDHEADGHEGHDHGPTTQANLDPEEIERRVCEHKVRTVDCDECRYELGVVKVDNSVTDALTRTTLVKEGNVGQTLHLTGEVQFDQTTVVAVSPAAPGKVVAVKARLGQKVQAGDVLAVVHSPEFGEAKATYLETQTAAEIATQEKQRQAGLSAALEKLLAASSGPSAQVPGDILGEWKSKLVNAMARLKQAKIVLEREKSLFARQASSKAELESADREMQTAQAEYTAILEEIQLNARLDRLKADNAAKLADARLAAAEQRLHMLGLDDETIAAIPRMRENGTFAQLRVRSPRAGVVTAMDVTEGRVVDSAATMFTIADTARVWVWCDLYERDLGSLHDRLARGQKPQAMLKVSAFDETFAGIVDLIDSAVNETTRTVKVRVQVSNDHGRLRPGMFASIDIPLTEDRKVALVPRHAVLSDEGITFAFVHWKGDLWLRRFVQVGQPQGEMLEILNGLSVGDKVVAAGGFLFKSDVLRAKMGAGCAD